MSIGRKLPDNAQHLNLLQVSCNLNLTHRYAPPRCILYSRCGTLHVRQVLAANFMTREELNDIELVRSLSRSICSVLYACCVLLIGPTICVLSSGTKKMRARASGNGTSKSGYQVPHLKPVKYNFNVRSLSSSGSRTSSPLSTSIGSQGGLSMYVLSQHIFLP